MKRKEAKSKGEKERYTHLNAKAQTIARKSCQEKKVFFSTQYKEIEENDRMLLSEPDILKREVKWALERITTNKASGGDGIPVELFEILKDDAVKVLPSVCQQIWKLSCGHRNGKVSFHSNPKERQCQRMLKLSHNCSHLSR